MHALLGYGANDTDESGDSSDDLCPDAPQLRADARQAQVSSFVSSATHNNNNEYSQPSDVGITKRSAETSLNQGELTNFFGLYSGVSDDDDCVTTPPKQRKTEKYGDTIENNITVGGEKIRLPDSDFWANTAVDVLRNSGAVSNDTSVNLSTSDGRPICSHYQLHQQTDKCHFATNRNMPVPNHQSACTKSASIVRHSQTTGVRTVNTDTRPIYYIHSKVAPHLQSERHECKLPKGARISLKGHQGVVNRVKWCCPNYSHLLLSASMDGSVKVWNCWSQLEPCLRSLNHHKKAVKDAEWGPDGKKILSCSFDRTVAVVDVITGRPEVELTAPGYLSCGKFHPVSSNLIVAGSNGCVLCWDIRQASGPIKTFTHKDRFGQVQDLIISPDGSQVFASCDLVSRDSADRSIIAWDFTSSVILSNQIFQERYVCSRLKLHPTEASFLAQTHGNYIAVFSINRPYKLNKYRRFEGHKMSGYNVGFDISPDGGLVCSGSGEGKMHFYRYQSGKTIRTVDTGWDVCMDVAYHPVLNSTVAGASWTGEVAVWS